MGGRMVRWCFATCASIALAAIVSSAAPATVTLAVPGRINEHLSMVSAGNVVAVAWGARVESGRTEIYSSVSRDLGMTFTAPVLVSGSRTDASISGEQPPRVVITPRTGGFAIAVVWTAKGPNGTLLLTARSDDDGRTFAAATVVPGSDAAGNRGWESIAALPDGRIGVVWLDHRDTLRTRSAAAPMNHEGMNHEGMSHAEHAAAADGAAKAQPSKLFFGFADGAGRPGFLTGSVCYCCKTAIAVGADGAIYTAWRHV